MGSKFQSAYQISSERNIREKLTLSPLSQNLQIYFKKWQPTKPRRIRYLMIYPASLVVPNLVRPYLRMRWKPVHSYEASKIISSPTASRRMNEKLIDKKKGTALSIVGCYVSRKVPFDCFKKEFLGYFPSLKVTEFKHAAQALTNIKLPAENIPCNITAMKALSRATVETYLRNWALTKGKFNEQSELPVPITN